MPQAHTQNTFQLIRPRYRGKGKIAPRLNIPCHETWGMEVKLHEFLTSAFSGDLKGPYIRCRRGILNRCISSRGWD